MIYYPIPCHRLPVYADRGISMPVAELLADEVLSVGCKLSVDTLAFGDNPCTLEICFSVGS